MKEWFASRGRKWHIGLCVCLTVLASTDLFAAEGDRGPGNQVIPQADTLVEGADQLSDAIHRLDPAKLAQQVEELLKEKTLLTPVERKIASQIRAILHPLSRRLSEAPAGATPSFKDLSTDLVRVNEQGEIQVYVILRDFTEDAVAQLEAMGLRVELTLPEHRLVQGWLGSGAIEAVAALDVVERVTPPDYLRTNSGLVNSQGDTVLRADVARSTFGANGSGVKVCVLSTGVDHLAASVASGDLPSSPPVQVLNNPGGDEGTAMLEIIHDLAPGAALAFYGAPTDAAFLLGLDAFAAAGCQVIVDDLIGPKEPKFEDGPMAQKVRQLATSGVVYVTSAGNYAQSHYFANYRRLLGQSFPTPSYPAVHNFSDASLDIGDTFVIPPNGAIMVVLQWSDKFGTSGNDFDLILARSDNFSILSFSNNVQNGGGDPIETLSYTNATGSPITAFISIAEFHLISDPSTIRLNYFVFPSNFSSPLREYVVQEESIFGHAALNEVLSVAAVNVANPTVIDNFSSRGPATIFFPSPEMRSVPRITGVDGVQTRVGQMGFFPINPFTGTSAAAPHVGAIAALLWSSNPALTAAQVVQRLTQTAVDLGAPGFDTTFGFGFVDAVLALSNSVASVTTLVAAVLPTERTALVGGPPVTAFATVINTGLTTALACAPWPLTPVAAFFGYQITNPQNALTGTFGTPVAIPPGVAQSFVFFFLPIAPFARTEIQLRFICVNSAPAPTFPGVNTFGLRATTVPASDPVALAATIGNTGIVTLASVGVFVVATFNVGAPGFITVSADTGAASLPVTIALCETNPATSDCLAPPTPTVQTQINSGATPTFGVFVTGTAPIPFDPANHRIQVHFEGGGGGGGTSVAVCSIPLCP